MSPQRGKLQLQGILQGHYKSGRIYRPPLLAYSEARIGDWVRDDLPDLLWPAALIALEGDTGGILFSRLQQAVASQIVHVGIDTDAVALDGRLTSLEAVPTLSRQLLLSIMKTEIANLELIPAPLLAALRLYPDLPGAWLLVDPWSHVDPGLNTGDALGFLAEVIIALAGDEHRQALLKFVPLAWLVLCRKISMPQEMINVLKEFPGHRASRPLADSMIRASFGSSKSADYYRNPEVQDRHATWAATFWRRNWCLSACLPEEGLPWDVNASADLVTDGTAEISQERSDIAGDENCDSEMVREFVDAAIGHFNRFLEQSMDRSANIDLYRPARHEVVSGLLSRASRAVIAILRAPHQWSGEHGSALTRLLAETEILLTWLDINGPDFYEKYQAYGLGKAKLMKNYMSELAKTFPEEPPDFLTEALNHLNEKLGGDRGERFTEVNLESTFAGVNLRRMAIEAGLKDLYDHVYQSASGVAHGEWWAIENYAMQRCLNPLHCFHLIPSLDPTFPTNSELGRFWVRKIDALVKLALSHLDAGPRPDGSDGEEV